MIDERTGPDEMRHRIADAHASDRPARRLLELYLEAEGRPDLQDLVARAGDRHLGALYGLTFGDLQPAGMVPAESFEDEEMAEIPAAGRARIDAALRRMLEPPGSSPARDDAADLEVEVAALGLWTAQLPDELERYLAEISAYPEGLDADELDRLAAARDRGNEEAVRQMVAAHLQLAAKLAEEQDPQAENRADLIRWGNTGVLLAARKYQPGDPLPFDAQVRWWVEHQIRKAAGEPPHARDRSRAECEAADLSRVEAELFESLGRRPTDRELADRLGVPVRLVRTLRPSSPSR
jgi:DNA-directed RNA polymerase sigma subunit (sigma70/sigma32)